MLKKAFWGNKIENKTPKITKSLLGPFFTKRKHRNTEKKTKPPKEKNRPKTPFAC